MTAVTILDAETRVWHQNAMGEDQSGDAPDTIIGPYDIQSVTIDERADDWLDEAGIDCELPENNEYDLRLGDRIEFWAELSDGRQIEWTGRIRPNDRTRENVQGVLGADAHDWVGDILSDRTITASWVGADVGQIIRDICERAASEVDVSQVPDFGITTDQFYQGMDCWDAITALAAKADALLHQDGMQLLAEPVGQLPYQFDLARGDYVLPWTTTTDTDVSNIIRVSSGVARRQEQAQETQDSWQRVTETSRLTHRLRARKSQIHSVELYVDAVASDEDLTIRLQADEGGAPVDVDNSDSDIENTSWDADNLPSVGWKSFFLPEHTLPDRDPWLIIEAGGSTGHDVGVDTNGVPTYRSFYPHPLTYEDSEPDSIDEYGARQIALERENLETITAVEDAVQAELARRAYPSKKIEFEAHSPRAHALTPGDRIGVNKPEEDAVGEFIVVECSRTFDADAVQLETQITATWRKGILAPLG